MAGIKDASGIDVVDEDSTKVNFSFGVMAEWDYTSRNPLDDIRRALDDVGHAARHYHQDVIEPIKREMKKSREAFIVLRSDMGWLYDVMTGLLPDEPLIDWDGRDDMTWKNALIMERLNRPVEQWDFSDDGGDAVLGEMLRGLKTVLQTCRDENQRADCIIAKQKKILKLFKLFENGAQEIEDNFRKIRNFDNEQFGSDSESVKSSDTPNDMEDLQEAELQL